MGVKGTDKISAPDVFVSECELAVGDPTIQAVLNKMGIEYVLFNLWGFDKYHVYDSTGKFYEISECTHRTRSGKVVTGKRFTGRERIDDAWIEEGNPSDNAKVIARQDMSYIREISNLGRQMKSL